MPFCESLISRAHYLTDVDCFAGDISSAMYSLWSVKFQLSPVWNSNQSTFHAHNISICIIIYIYIMVVLYWISQNNNNWKFFGAFNQPPHRKNKIIKLCPHPPHQFILNPKMLLPVSLGDSHISSMSQWFHTNGIKALATCAKWSLIRQVDEDSNCKLVKAYLPEISATELCPGVRVKDYGDRFRREEQRSKNTDSSSHTQGLLFSKHFVDPKEAFQCLAFPCRFVDCSKLSCQNGVCHNPLKQP